jgi:hypothetical protein
LKVGNSTKVGKIQSRADCEANWNLVRKWLRVCQDTHPMCSQDSSSRQLPTRLIDVGTSDMDLKLCLTESLPRDTQYLTLSHCWGGKVFTMLTRNNFREFLSHILAGDLSKTFKDAIVATRSLGFKYLWIDSLCIIQGDEPDWQRESSRMGAVYTNSALNTAAAAAPNGDFGCFSTRRLDRMHGCKVAMRTRRDSSHTTAWDCSVLVGSENKNALNSRAWVYQESFLAPRTLSFTAHELFWECISSMTCETFPDSYNYGAVTRPSVARGRR